MSKWVLLPWTVDAADHFDRLRALRVKTGTLDLRIACIALEYEATVLTRNLADFRHVPGLKVENWLD
jgi:tRNA(fMet)-specific endonuclease VapC